MPKPSYGSEKLVTEAADAFDRAADREAKIGGRPHIGGPQVDQRRAQIGINTSFAAAALVSLLIHWLIVRNLTGWVIAHVGFVGFCFVGLLLAWTVGGIAHTPKSGN